MLSILYDESMDVKSLPDEDLAIYVREVDLDAYREFVSRYEIPLLQYIRPLVGNELKSQEIAQEAFIRCFRNINAFNVKTKFSIFLYRCTHQVLKEELHKKNQELGTYENMLEDLSGEDDAEHEFADREFLGHIKKHLHKLPAKYKESLVLHFISQKSYDEIVEILQIPLSSVSARIGLSKTLIKKYAKN